MFAKTQFMSHEQYSGQAKPGLRPALIRLDLGSDLVVLVYEGLEHEIMLI